MKKITLALTLLALVLSGCVDVRIKSMIPKKTYYSLDISDVENGVCPNFQTIGLGDFSSLSLFNSTNIIKKQGSGQIDFLENTLWIDSPKEMLRVILIKNALKECISLESGSLQRVKKFLSIKVLFLGFLDDKALVEIAYRLNDARMKPIKMGIIKKQEQGDNIQLLQNLTQEAAQELLSSLR